MEKELLHLVEIVSAAADAAILEELLLAAGFSPSAYTNLESRLASTYVIAENADEAADILLRIKVQLPDWEGLLNQPLRGVEQRTMRQEDWSESWKKHFHTFRASERLMVKPSWEEYHAQPGDLVLKLDPGMCFGTGYHGTTKACLQFLDQLQKQIGSDASFLDAGCGSGILSIGARLLGYNPVFAFDYDPQAVETARENLTRAGFSEVTLAVADVKDYIPPQPCRVVVANILAAVLLENAVNILRFLDLSAEPAFLILSGILNEQYEEIRQHFTALGAEQMATRTLEEWTSGCFRVVNPLKANE